MVHPVIATKKQNNEEIFFYNPALLKKLSKSYINVPDPY